MIKNSKKLVDTWNGKNKIFYQTDFEKSIMFGKDKSNYVVFKDIRI